MLQRLILCLSLVYSLHAPAADKPNIIIIYADDLGYGDLGCYGHPIIRTPNLDRLAAEGARFTQFYSAAEVCTPSRAALLTGRYPVRNGMCHDSIRVLRKDSPGGLPKEEVTLAEMLKENGYFTGMIGKWHLGHQPQHLPPSHGFNYYLGLPFSNDMMPSPDAPKTREKFFEENLQYWQTPLMQGTEIIDPAPDQRTLTRTYSEAAVKFIGEHKNEPFFLYMAHTFPHVPLFASDDFRGKSAAGIYGDVVEEIDWSVGKVLEALRLQGLEQRTLIFFSSDNGPWLIFDHHGGSAGPLKDGKGCTWEGGMRVPGILWWPGKIKPAVHRSVTTTMDILPTCAALTGTTLPSCELDGYDLSPLLLGTGEVNRTEPFAYYRGTRLFAIRQGPWKAHFTTQTGYGKDQPIPHDPPLLFNVEEDLGEQRDLGAQHPEILQQMQAAYATHLARVKPSPTQLEGKGPEPRVSK